MSTRISPIVSHLNLAAGCGLRDASVTASAYVSDPQLEYQCVRERVGLSDLTYYAKVRVSGAAALDLINHVIITDLARLPINQTQTSILLSDDGRPCGEALVMNCGDYYLVLSEGVEPSVLFERLSKIADHQFPDAIVTNQTETLGLLGIDGPFSWEVLKSFMGIGVIGLRYLEILPDQALNNIPFTIFRAGKTGEYGYVLLTSGDKLVALWDALMEIGKRFDIQPIGYNTLDLCKLENRFVNQQQEGARVDNVLALNTRVLVSRDKGDYAGSAQIAKLMASGSPSRIIGITFAADTHVDKPGLSVGDEVLCHDEKIGTLASLGYSYTLKQWIALALVDTTYAYVGLDYTVGEYTARTVSAPFIFNRSLQIRPQEDSYFN